MLTNQTKWGVTMNRNIGQTQTFTAKFPRHQTVPVAFSYVRTNGVGEVQEMVVNVKTADLDQVAQNGQDVVDAFIFANAVLQHRGAAIKANATKLNLDPEYRKIKLNQTTTRFVVKGYFSAGRTA